MTEGDNTPDRHAVHWLAGALVAGLTLTACGGGGGGGNGADVSAVSCDTFDCTGMLENLATNVMRPTFVDFQAAAGELETDIGAYCNALGTAGETAALETAQGSWKEAMAVWQHAEVMQLGPLAENSGELRDTIYSWPFTNTCSVDQDVINAEQDPGFDIAARTLERRGLDALEYLLFSSTLDHTCASNITVTQGWNARPEAERRQARCEFAALAVGDVATQADDLMTRWDAFASQLTNTADPAATVNEVSDALFYVEDLTKDVKLRVPLGLSSNSCDGQPCPEDVESRHSKTSKDNVRNNLVAFQTLFLGNEAGASDDRLGFDDFLNQEDPNVSSLMESAVAGAIESVSEANFPGTMYDDLENTDGNLVAAAQSAAKVLTDQLKEDFINVLGLQIPGSAAGDGD